MDPNNTESETYCEAEFYEAVICKLEERKVQRDKYIINCRWGLECNRALRGLIYQVSLVGLIDFPWWRLLANG